MRICGYLCLSLSVCYGIYLSVCVSIYLSISDTCTSFCSFVPQWPLLVILQSMMQTIDRIPTIGTQLKIVATVKATMIGAQGT